MVYGVILAGGKGERFWPLSRTNRPKQFLRLTSDKMMLEETMDRVLPIIERENFRIVTGDQMAGFILESVPTITQKHIIAEPFGRNTCIAIGIAAAHIAKEDPKGVMVVLSADHLIRPPERLCQLIQAAVSIAESEDKLLTIGVVPTRPETAYGYIKLGDVFNERGDTVVHKVDSFVEKPKLVVAQEYYYSRNYLWNSGMFIWSAASILKAIHAYEPEMGKLLDAYAPKIGTAEEKSAREALYKEVKSVSIDVGILERANNVLTVKGDIIWDDVGGWNALERYKHRDGDNNVVIGEVLTMDTYETTIYNNADGLIACLGISDLVVVRTDNITFVAHKTKTDAIKKILEQLSSDEKKRQYL